MMIRIIRITPEWIEENYSVPIGQPDARPLLPGISYHCFLNVDFKLPHDFFSVGTKISPG
jgi:hypothetical protein